MSTLWGYGEKIQVRLGAEARERADDLQWKKSLLPTLDIDFSWTPSSSVSVSIGTSVVTIHETIAKTPITFTATANLTYLHYIVNYIWDFGDGTKIENGPVIDYTFTASNYQNRVTLTVIDNYNNRFSVGHQIYLVPFVAPPEPGDHSILSVQELSVISLSS